MEFKPVKTMDVQDTLRILSEYKGPDLIRQEVEREEGYFKNKICIKCGSKALLKIPQMAQKEDELGLYKEPLFGEILPKNNLKCKDCNCEFNPYLGLVVGLT